ncbi:MAG: hypothetical protein GXP55_11345 [Deltaproteobacteria bacterium]|nr:hypothetical protein [Deltaproteobacteria bacterium]
MRFCNLTSSCSVYVGALFVVLMGACGDDSGSPDGSVRTDASSVDASSGSDAGARDAAADAWIPPTTGDWTPPIGIPRPDFGIEEVAPDAPAPWDAETAGFYYVDNTHAAATDDANDYGTPAKPRLSIPTALSPGDVVVVRGGPYVGDLRFSGDGSAARPIFISGGPEDAPPIIQGHVQLSGSYLLFERFVIDDANAGVSVRTPSDHVAVRFSEIRNATGRGAGLYTGRWGQEADAATASQIVFYANRLHDLGNWRIASDEDHHGVGIGHHADHVWIVDNEMSRCSGDGVQVNARKAYLMETLHHVYIGRNQAWENKQTGFWTKQAVDVVISQNRVWGMRPSGSSEGSGLGFQYGPERVWFLYNEVFDCENGIKSSTNTSDEDGVAGTGQDVYIIGNVFRDIHKSDGSGPTSDPWQYGSAIRLTDQTATKHVIANTVYDTDVGLTYARGVGPLVIRNNVFTNVAGAQVLLETSEAAGGSSIATGLFDPAAAIRWGSRTVYDLAGFRAAYSGQCDGCVEATPDFTDAAGGDLSLRAGSPGVDQGGASDAYARFESLYGISIDVGFDGTARPVGGGPDMGAFER